MPLVILLTYMCYNLFGRPGPSFFMVFVVPHFGFILVLYWNVEFLFPSRLDFLLCVLSCWLHWLLGNLWCIRRLWQHAGCCWLPGMGCSIPSLQIAGRGGILFLKLLRVTLCCFPLFCSKLIVKSMEVHFISHVYYCVYTFLYFVCAYKVAIRCM